MASADGTARGLLNSVTEFVHHHRRARSDDNGKDSTWFGAGAALKQKAFDEAMKLIASIHAALLIHARPCFPAGRF
jgi:hypothetical protein